MTLTYPIVRLRRNRLTDWLRDLTAETNLTATDLVLPIFVIEGHSLAQEIKTMPGVFRQPIDQVLKTAKAARQQGIRAIALFPCIENNLKSEDANEAYNPDNLICRTIKALKNANIGIGICCDVALDPYTTHGHDGIFIDNDVNNDQTVKALAHQALILARAGADIIAPSDMMDGRVMAIRQELDSEGFININILAYSAKYNSSFYSPFRDAVNSKRKTYLNKATYQMDIRNSKEALREIHHDICEGADMIMIKPGMPFLDVIAKAAQDFTVPIFAYQVSGEYAMLKIAAINEALDWEQAIIESLTAFKRAGVTGIFTYAALEAAEFLNKNK